MSRSGPGGDDLKTTVRAFLADHPVWLGLLFGYRARGESHATSDIDVAVVFDDLEPGDPGYTEALLGLGADIAVALGTDDVDVVDLRRAAPRLVRAAFADGVVLIGADDDTQALREQLLAGTEAGDRSPAERFDDVLAAIDDQLA